MPCSLIIGCCTTGSTHRTGPGAVTFRLVTGPWPVGAGGGDTTQQLLPPKAIFSVFITALPCLPHAGREGFRRTTIRRREVRRSVFFGPDQDELAEPAQRMVFKIPLRIKLQSCPVLQWSQKQLW